MKKSILILLLTVFLLQTFYSFSQCSVTVHDSLYANYDLVLNAENATGTAPFVYAWSITDGNGAPISFSTSTNGDTAIINSSVLQSTYGCIIYQLCVTDYTNCTSCYTDTNISTVPFSCLSQFTANYVSESQVSVTLNNTIPSFLVLGQFLNWTNGDGQSQQIPYTGPGTMVNYTPGNNNSSDKFLLCAFSALINGGCISCDSVTYTTALSVHTIPFEQEIQISPNPASDQITIASEKTLIKEIILYTQEGKELIHKTGSFTELQLNIEILQAGSYTLVLKNQFGTISKKLMVVKD